MTRRHAGPARVLLLLLAIAAAAVVMQENAEAHPCTDDETIHRDSRDRACDQLEHNRRHGTPVRLAGNLPQDFTLEMTPPEHTFGDGLDYFEPEDRVEITLNGFDLSELTDAGSASEEEPIIYWQIKDQEQKAGYRTVTTDTTTNTLTLTDLDSNEAFQTQLMNEPSKKVLLKISKLSGIRAPSIPGGFDDKSEPYHIEVRFVDTDPEEGMEDTSPVYHPDEHYFVIVRNPVSSNVPDDKVRLDLDTVADAPINGNQDIVVNFAGPTEDTSFTLPETIDEKNVTLSWKGQSPVSAGAVSVETGRVIITVPAGPEDDPTVIEGPYTITFKERAGIRNPKAAGNRIISVHVAARPDQVHDIIAVIRRTTTADPPKGPRGTTFTLEGKGYADGTVTIFDGEDRNIDAGERLGFANTEEAAFTLELTARGDPGSPYYRVWTLDGNGVYHSVDFLIESDMSFDPERVRSGEELRIDIADWETTQSALAAVTIGGIVAYRATAVEYQDCFELGGPDLHTPDSTGTVAIRLRVPVNLPPGRQNVAAYGPEQVRIPSADGSLLNKRHCAYEEDTATLPEEDLGDPIRPERREVIVTVAHDPVASRPIELLGRAIRVVPETGARGQRVTIIGSGIGRISAQGRDIRQIAIGGTEVAENPSLFEVPVSGEFALDVTVPEDAEDGPNELRVVGSDGSIAHGVITVHAPDITVTPGGGRQGSGMTVEGSGFVAQGIISIYYGDGGDLASKDQLIKVVIADRKGAFTAKANVPLDAKLGTRHSVSAVARTGQGNHQGPIRARADHTVTAGQIGADKNTACAGDRITITGRSLPRWSIVQWLELGGLRISPGHAVHTDENGAFTATVTVPALPLGNQTLRVLVAGTTYVDVIELVGPPLQGHPSRVFKELIQAGALERAWHYDNASMTWSFFDPNPDFAEFNDMEDVRSGLIMFLLINREYHFQGQMLYAGWNALRLK